MKVLTVSPVVCLHKVHTVLMLQFFMKCDRYTMYKSVSADDSRIWHRLVMAGRAVSQKVTRHNGKMGSITVSDLCAAVQHCWAEIVHPRRKPLL